MKNKDITGLIIGCSFKVSNTLGCGFVEKVYEKALVYELRKQGLQAEAQYPVQVYYDGFIVGEFLIDILVENCIVVELKALKALDQNHYAQCINYLKATKLKTCLLINFGQPRVEHKRIILENP
ncbi:GxxExxY protein [Gloeothece citriformis]|nr:GxxExxY protein [Gloeothece citriformis]